MRGLFNKVLLGFIVGVALATACYGQVSISLGQTCAGELDSERACLEQEGSLAHWTDLRNALTLGMVDAGGGDCGGVSCYVVLICDQCAVDKWIGRSDIEGSDGCVMVGDRVVMHRWAVMAHRLGCLATQLRGNALEEVARRVAIERLNRAADLGSGTPTLIDRRPESPGCDEEGCG